MDAIADSRTGELAESQHRSFRAHVEAEQIRLIYRQLPFAVVGAIVGAFVTFFVVRNTVDQDAGVAWLLGVIISYSGVLVLYRSYRGSSSTDRRKPIWGTRLAVIGWLAASSWGAASFWLYNPNSAMNILLLSTFLLVGAAAILVTTVSYRPLFYSAFALLIPLLVVLLMEPDNLRLAMAIGVATFSAVLLFQHRHSHQVLENALTLRFENHALAEQLALQREQALEASQAKSRFLAVASHDLRQPLHAQQLFLSRLQQQFSNKRELDPELCGELCEKLSASIASLTEVFGSLLDFSRFESGEVAIHKAGFSARDLLLELQSEYALRAESEGLRFSVYAIDASVYTDRALLSRALRNLLENALRYTVQGGVLLGSRRRGDFLSVEVWDTGKGFGESDTEAIFKQFHQLEPSAGVDEGLGLGLAVVRQVAQLLELPLQVRSIPDRGSLFALRIPMARHPVVPSHTQSYCLSHGQGVKDVRILLIEDNQDAQLAMQELLQSWGYEVLCAKHGPDLDLMLDELKTVNLLILADYRLGDVETGAASIAWLRKLLSPTIPAAFVTADDSPELHAAARELSCPVLRKPLDAGKLRSVLRYLEAQLMEVEDAAQSAGCLPSSPS